jgi:hypothetical protein
MNSETSVLESPALKPARPGLSWRGLIEVFYKPTQLFEEIKYHPRILVPFIVVTAALFVSMYLMADMILDIQIEAMKANPNMSGGNIPSREMMKPFIYVGSVLWMLGPLVTAALAMLVGTFFMGGKSNYKQLLSVMLYASVVYIIGGMVMIPLVLAKGSLYISIGPAALMSDPSMTDPIYLLLTKFSLFNIWEIIVAGIGLSIMYDFKRNKGYIMAVCSIGLISVLHVVQTALFS